MRKDFVFPIIDLLKALPEENSLQILKNAGYEFLNLVISLGIPKLESIVYTILYSNILISYTIPKNRFSYCKNLHSSDKYEISIHEVYNEYDMIVRRSFEYCVCIKFLSTVHDLEDAEELLDHITLDLLRHYAKKIRVIQGCSHRLSSEEILFFSDVENLILEKSTYYPYFTDTSSEIENNTLDPLDVTANPYDTYGISPIMCHNLPSLALKNSSKLIFLELEVDSCINLKQLERFDQIRVFKIKTNQYTLFGTHLLQNFEYLEKFESYDTKVEEIRLVNHRNIKEIKLFESETTSIYISSLLKLKSLAIHNLNNFVAQNVYISKVPGLECLEVPRNHLTLFQKFRKDCYLNIKALVVSHCKNDFDLTHFPKLRKLKIEAYNAVENQFSFDSIADITTLNSDLLPPINSSSCTFFADSHFQSTLKSIYMTRCSLSSMTYFKHFRNLRVLELDSNNLTSVEGAECLSSLECLSLSRNKIRTVGELPKSLKVLDLSNNKITRWDNLDHLENLMQLSLLFNPVRYIGSLKSLKFLTSVFLTLSQKVQFETITDLPNLKRLFLFLEKSVSFNPKHTFKGLNQLEEFYLSSMVTYLGACRHLFQCSQLRLLKLNLPRIQETVFDFTSLHQKVNIAVSSKLFDLIPASMKSRVRVLSI